MFFSSFFCTALRINLNKLMFRKRCFCLACIACVTVLLVSVDHTLHLSFPWAQTQIIGLPNTTSKRLSFWSAHIVRRITCQFSGTGGHCFNGDTWPRFPLLFPLCHCQQSHLESETGLERRSAEVSELACIMSLFFLIFFGQRTNLHQRNGRSY